jgi:D-alanyl-D-alanine carboxypeptidase (penicillin-binding protein 5/6)
VVYARNAFRKRPMASTAKMMTALVAVENASLGRRFRVVNYPAASAESVAGLQPGERVTNAGLLQALMIASANDAAATLAVGIAGSNSRFVKLMNRRAAAAGLTSTRFANPVGLDAPGAYSTARDLARLGQLVRRNAYLRRIVDRPRATINAGERKITLYNRNTLVGQVPWISGIKTGHTQRAGYLLVGSGERSSVPLVSVVMGTPSEAARNRDTIRLMRYGFPRFRAVIAARKGKVVARVPVALQGTSVAVAPSRTLRVVARRGEKVTVVQRGLPAEVSGPLARGSRVGEIVASRRGRVAGRVSLVTTEPVAAATLWQRFSGTPAALAGAAVLVLVAAATLVASRRRRSRGRRPARRRRPA